MPFNVQRSIKSKPVLLLKCLLINVGNTDNLLERFYSSSLVTDAKAFSSSNLLTFISLKVTNFPLKKETGRNNFVRRKPLWNLQKVNLFFFLGCLLFKSSSLGLWISWPVVGQWNMSRWRHTYTLWDTCEGGRGKGNYLETLSLIVIFSDGFQKRTDPKN